MIEFKHYYYSEELIESENVRFRRFSAQPLTQTENRFVQFINGELEELLPEDFGDVTEIPEYTCYNIYTGDKLRRVVLPDTVETINTYAFFNNNIMEIVFSSNIKKICDYSCYSLPSNSIADFSKAKQIPTRLPDKNSTSTIYPSFNTSDMVIKVPSTLYNTWKSRSDWKDVADKIVAV